MIGANCNLFGVIMGFVLPSILIDGYDENIPYTADENAAYEQ